MLYIIIYKKKFFFPSFPSYPNVTIGACIANCTHGISPKYGVISDFVKEIKLFNPNFGYKTLSNNKIKKYLFSNWGYGFNWNNCKR